MTKKEPANTDNKLKNIVQNIETLEDTKQDILDNIKEAYKEAKYAGYDIKTIRKIIQIRKKGIHKIREEEDLLEFYKQSLGIVW
jgi:uncharacterized protein (UPF0335 family)